MCGALATVHFAGGGGKPRTFEELLNQKLSQFSSRRRPGGENKASAAAKRDLVAGNSTPAEVAAQVPASEEVADPPRRPDPHSAPPDEEDDLMMGSADELEEFARMERLVRAGSDDDGSSAGVDAEPVPPAQQAESHGLPRQRSRHVHFADDVVGGDVEDDVGDDPDAAVSEGGTDGGIASYLEDADDVEDRTMGGRAGQGAIRTAWGPSAGAQQPFYGNPPDDERHDPSQMGFDDAETWEDDGYPLGNDEGGQMLDPSFSARAPRDGPELQRRSQLGVTIRRGGLGAALAASADAAVDEDNRAFETWTSTQDLRSGSRGGAQLVDASYVDDDAVAREGGRLEREDPPSPPTSSVVRKYFKKPSTRAQPPRTSAAAQSKPKPKQQPNSKPEPSSGDSALEAKIRRLEREISRYKAETTRTRRLQNEAKLKTSAAERRLQERTRAFEEEQRKAKDALAAQRRALNRERSRMEKRYKDLVSLPDRKERDEVARARAELSAVRVAARSKEDKLKSQVARLGSQVKAMQREKRETRRRLQEAEEARIAARAEVDEMRAALLEEKRAHLALRKRYQSMLERIAAARGAETTRDVAITNGGGGGGSGSGGGSGIVVAGSEPPADETTDKNEPSVVVTRHAVRRSRAPAERKMSGLGARLEAVRTARKQRTKQLVEFRFVPETDIAHRHVPVREEINHVDGKAEKIFNDGAHLISFGNGTQKLVLPNGYSQIAFPNGDIKEATPGGKTVYHYDTSDITQISDQRVQVFFFGTNQMERHCADGSKEIFFADESAKLIVGGEEYNILPDGKAFRVTKSGSSEQLR